MNRQKLTMVLIAQLHLNTLQLHFREISKTGTARGPIDFSSSRDKNHVITDGFRQHQVVVQTVNGGWNVGYRIVVLLQYLLLWLSQTIV